MVSTRANFDTSKLDSRLLWSRGQSDIADSFANLVSKCRSLSQPAPLVLVTTDAAPTHLIAAFNLASAFSFDHRTMLLDATPDASLATGLLHLSEISDSGLTFVHRLFALTAIRSHKVLPPGWPAQVIGQVAEQMISLVLARDAFQIEWSELDSNVRVIAMASPNELEEERWSRLFAQVSGSRFLGLWVVD